jgi:hypothetical protein
MPTKAKLEEKLVELQNKLNQSEQAANAEKEQFAAAAAEKDETIAELQRQLTELQNKRESDNKDVDDPVDKDATDASERPEGNEKPSGRSARSTRAGSAKSRKSGKKGREDSDPDPSDSEPSSDESSSESDSRSESDSDSVSKSDSDPDDGKRRRKRKKSKTNSKAPKTTLDWKHFDFSLDKENHLQGVENWSIYKNALMLSLESIGYDAANKRLLTRTDQLRIAKAVIKTSKRDVLELIDGIKKGTQVLRLLGRTYKTSGRVHRQAIWEEVAKVVFDGGDPVSFISKFKTKVRECKDTGLKISADQQVAMFLAATKEKAYGWTKRQKTAMRKQDLSLQDLMEDLTDEFREKIGKQKKSDIRGNAHNAGSGKRGNDNRGRPGRKPARNDKGEPLCFECHEYGHMAKDCQRPKKEESGEGSRSHQSSTTTTLPPELEPESNSFRAIVGQARLREMEALIEEQCNPRQPSPSSQRGKGIPGNGLEGVASPTTPTTMAITYSTRHNVSGSKHELFDTGSDCNITNDERDFVDGKHCDLSARKFPIQTGAGPVFATKVGTTRTILRGPKGEPVSMYKKVTFFVPGFPIKIFSGDRFYRAGHRIEGDKMVNKEGRTLSMFNVAKRGFLLWHHGAPEPEITNAPEH